MGRIGHEQGRIGHGQGRIRHRLGRIGGERCRQRAGGGPCWRMNPGSLRRRDALAVPRVATISRMSESCSPSGSLPLTSALLPTKFSTHVDLHRRQCGTGSISSIVLSFLFLSSIYLWGTPRGPIPLPDRSPPPCQPFIRDFRPLIPALRGRRLHGRLGG